MGQIYVTNKTKKDLKKIADNQHRKISDEITLLTERRLAELGIEAHNETTK